MWQGTESSLEFGSQGRQAASEPDESASGKSARVRMALQDRFSKGAYRFGQRLVVLELAREFDVSRQPVMAALTELKGDGFVVITPQVGCQAAHPTRQEISDFFSVFAKMEGRMAGLAAERRADAQAAQLQVLHREMEARAATPGHQNLEGINHFHRMIRQMAATPVVAARVAKFWFMANYILRNGTRNYTAQVQAVGRGERARIVQAIAERDSVAAEQLMEQHVLGKPHRVELL